MSFTAALEENLRKNLMRHMPEFTRNIKNLKFLDKRTSILDERSIQGYLAPKRMPIFEAFRNFNLKIVPMMEKSIELNLLQNRFEKIENPVARESLLHAYHKRELDRMVFKSDVSKFVSPPEIASLKALEKPKIYCDPNILSHEDSDIGYYVKFSQEDFSKYFPKGFYGPYQETEYRYTKEFSLLCTEEALRIVNEMKRITQVSDGLDLTKYFTEKSTLREIEFALEDENNYPIIFQHFACSFIEALKPYRNDTFFQKLFHTSSIFDLVVHVMVAELRTPALIPFMNQKEHRNNIFAQIAKIIEQNADHCHPNPLDLKYFLKTVNKFVLELPNNEGSHTVELKNYLNYPKFIPEYVLKFGIPRFHGFNSGILVHGPKGAGKSGILAYVTMWAHKAEFLVISVPKALKWCQEGKDKLVRHHLTGLYLQPDYAVEFLEHLKSANLELLQKISVKKDIYGKYNTSGLHDNDCEAVPNTYDEKRKVFFKDYEQFYHPDEFAECEQEDKLLEKRLGVLLPNPKNLLEIIEFGIKNKLHATNAIYEVLEQAYNQEDYKVAVIVDDYNWLFRPSIYPSFRYANNKENDGFIPPVHLSLCRAFINFDGHKIKNGFKVVASGINHLRKHKFEPEDIFFPQGYRIKANGLLLNDYRTVLNYYAEKKLWRPLEYEVLSHEQYWMETQGNWHETIYTILNHGRE